MQKFSHQYQLWDALLLVMLLWLGAGGIGMALAVRGGFADAWQISAGVLSLMMATALVYGSTVGTRRITTSRTSIRIAGMPCLRAVVFSDPHMGPFKDARFLRILVERVNRLEPDIILIPGDFVYDEKTPMDMFAPLKELRATHGAFAVMGNHDTGRFHDLRKNPFRGTDISDRVTSTLQGLGITVLRQESVELTVDGQRFTIAGTDDVWDDNHEVIRPFLANIDPGIPSILLSHSPDVLLLSEHLNARLIISGHTHGGQIRLPVIGPLLPIPSHVGRRYDRGLFRSGDRTQLFITHGTGETMLRSRFFAPPEIVMMDLGE